LTIGTGAKQEPAKVLRAVQENGRQSTLYRRMQILLGYGFQLDRSTLGRWMKQAAWMLNALYLLQRVLMHGYRRLFCDETPMPVLDPGRERTKICQFWTHATDDRPWLGPTPPAVANAFAKSGRESAVDVELARFEHDRRERA
jgi:transposase